MYSGIPPALGQPALEPLNRDHHDANGPMRPASVAFHRISAPQATVRMRGGRRAVHEARVKALEPRQVMI